jgi:hypothetical protein
MNRAQLLHPKTQQTTMAVQSTFQEWSLEKEILEPKKRTISGSSSPEFFDAEDKLKIAPRMEELEDALQKKSAQNLFDERYLSSEEALSQTEPDLELSDHDYDLDDILDDASVPSSSKHSSKSSIIDLATAVAIISAGKPKVIEVPASPTTDGSDHSRQSSVVLRRKAKRPILSTRFSATSFALFSTPTSPASIPSTSSNYSRQDVSRRPSTSIAQLSTPTSPASNYSREDVSGRPSTSFSNFQFGSVAKRKSRLGDLALPTIPSPKPFYRPFLNTNPFASQSTTSLALPEPEGKPRHWRLRSISQKISNMTRKTKSEESDPSSPTVPHRRRDSFTMLSPLYSTTIASRKQPRLQARGAAEREPPIEIPPCPFESGHGALFAPPQMRPLARKPVPQRRKSLLGLV